MDIQAGNESDNSGVVRLVDKVPEATIKEVASKDPGADDMLLMRGRKIPGLYTGFSLRSPGIWRCHLLSQKTEGEEWD